MLWQGTLGDYGLVSPWIRLSQLIPQKHDELELAGQVGSLFRDDPEQFFMVWQSAVLQGERCCQGASLPTQFAKCEYKGL